MFTAVALVWRKSGVVSFQLKIFQLENKTVMSTFRDFCSSVLMRLCACMFMYVYVCMYMCAFVCACVCMHASFVVHKIDV